MRCGNPQTGKVAAHLMFSINYDSFCLLQISLTKDRLMIDPDQT